MDGIIGAGAPIYFDHANRAVSRRSPGNFHSKNSGLQRYFSRYLLQKAISVFEWTLPETWAKDYFLYTLYCWGFVAVVKTDKFGVIPQGCSLSGYDVFYRPTTATISNPLLSGILQPRIGTQCALIKLQPDYGGIMDIVDYYSDLLAVCAETAGLNIANSKLAYIFGADNKGAAESYKKMMDGVLSGEPAVFVDKNLLDDNGQPRWWSFAQNLRESYIAPDVLADMRRIEQEFDMMVGIPTANTDKKERLISAEVESNVTETRALCEIWLESLQAGVQQARDLFGLEDLSVDWRAQPEVEEVPENDED